MPYSLVCFQYVVVGQYVSQEQSARYLLLPSMDHFVLQYGFVHRLFFVLVLDL